MLKKKLSTYLNNILSYKIIFIRFNKYINFKKTESKMLSKKNSIKIGYRFLLTLISAIFIFASIDKIFLSPEMVESFKSFGLPKEFMVIVGFTELVLAILLPIKHFTKLASHGLISILTFGIFFHLVNGQYSIILFPISIIFLLIVCLNLGQRVKNLN